MNVVSYSTKVFLLAALAASLLVSTIPTYGQNAPPVPDDTHFNLLVLGDSIAWGQGLREEHKAWYLVKTWLEKNSGRPVRERVEAHSGAVIGSVGGSAGNPLPLQDGEVNRGLPSVNDQIENALGRLRAEYASAGRGPLFDLLKDYVWGDKNALSLAEIAGRLDLTEEAVKKSVQRLRQRFRDALRAEVAQTGATPDQIDEELRHLRAALSADRCQDGDWIAASGDDIPRYCDFNKKIYGATHGFAVCRYVGKRLSR